MAKRERDAVLSEPAPSGLEGERPRPDAGPARRDDSTAPAGVKPRISFNLTEDGKIDFAGMRAATRTKLAELFKDRETRTALLPNEPAAAANETSPMALDVAVEVLANWGAIETWAAPKLLKIRPEIARQVFPWNEAEIAMVAPPFAAILEKYAPALISRYGEEALFVMAFVKITQQKIILALQMEMRERGKAVNGASITDQSEVTQAAGVNGGA